MSQSTPLVPMKEKISYGFGDLASVLYWQTFMLYFTFFYTDVFLIPVGAAATLFLVSRIIDGINDPLMGILADRTKTRWGKFRPYLLWLCVPFAIAGVLVFTVPDFGPTGKLIYAYITFTLIMVLYTAINIPYTALLGVISPNSNDRTTISSVKFLFAFAAGIIVSATLLPMVKGLGGGDDAKGWTLSFVIYGIAAVVFFLITFKGTKERVQPPPAQKQSIKKDLQDLVTNKPWLILLATTITFILFVAVRGSVTVHYFKYVVGTQQLSLPFMGEGSYTFESITSVYNTIGQISAFLGVLMVSWVANKIGKKKAFTFIFLIAAFSTGIIYFIPVERLGLLFFFQITGSMTGGPLSVLLWAMYADTADYAEWKNGRRATGLVFSASTMSQKFGWAFGAYIALMLMATMGFSPNEAQSAESLNGLVLLFSLIPALIGIISIGILFAYPLDEDFVDKMSTELAERRGEAETEPA